MNYTKISTEQKPWLSIITEDLDKSSQKPLFMLADRFFVHGLKVTRHHYDGRLVAYLITGNEKKEKLMVFLEIDQCDMVVHFVMQKGILFDGELAKYLGFALILHLKAKRVYNFSPTILQKK